MYWASNMAQEYAINQPLTCIFFKIIKLRILYQAHMIRGKRWLLLILCMFLELVINNLQVHVKYLPCSGP